MAMVASPVLAQDSSSSLPTDASSSVLASSSSMGPLPPAGLSDADLELAVRAAYTGASTFAAAHGNYFARDGVFPPLRDAIVAELAKEGFGTITVPAIPADESAEIKTCLATPGAELRIAISTYGDGIDLGAVTDTRAFGYAYDPHKAADIVVTKAEDCTGPK
jgi:hypothetical protein